MKIAKILVFLVEFVGINLPWLYLFFSGRIRGFVFGLLGMLLVLWIYKATRSKVTRRLACFLLLVSFSALVSLYVGKQIEAKSFWVEFLVCGVYMIVVSVLIEISCAIIMNFVYSAYIHGNCDFGINYPRFGHQHGRGASVVAGVNAGNQIDYTNSVAITSCGIDGSELEGGDSRRGTPAVGSACALWFVASAKSYVDTVCGPSFQGVDLASPTSLLQCVDFASPDGTQMPDIWDV